MSNHNLSYLVSSHQAELARHAAEHRLATKERRIAVTPSTTDTQADPRQPIPSPVRRILVQVAGMLRPVRRFGVDPRS